MAALQPKEQLCSFTEWAYTMFVKDIKAIPEDKLNVPPGAGGRSPLHIAAECAVVNQRVAGYLRGEEIPRPSPEEREALLCSFDTREKVLAFLEEGTQTLLKTLEELDENTLGDSDEEFFKGMPMNRFSVAQLPAMHMMYHDGQVNYIQTLCGDDKMHWRD
jgi:hypothetical protein